MTQSQKERNEQLRALRAQGMTYAQIADRIGISRQRVASICGRFGPGHYSGVFMRQWAYPNIVAWMTENRLTFSEFLRRIGYDHPAPNIIQHWRDIMIAKHDPRKRDIDRMIAVTGLNYEALFAKERVNEAPAVDAETVRHGRWIPDGVGSWYCSECHTTDDYAYFKTYGGETGKQQDIYCPNCGAKMDGGL